MPECPDAPPDQISLPSLLHHSFSNLAKKTKKKKKYLSTVNMLYSSSLFIPLLTMLLLSSSSTAAASKADDEAAVEFEAPLPSSSSTYNPPARYLLRNNLDGGSLNFVSMVQRAAEGFALDDEAGANKGGDAAGSNEEEAGESHRGLKGGGRSYRYDRSLL